MGIHCLHQQISFDLVGLSLQDDLNQNNTFLRFPPLQQRVRIPLLSMNILLVYQSVSLKFGLFWNIASTYKVAAPPTSLNLRDYIQKRSDLSITPLFRTKFHHQHMCIQVVICVSIIDISISYVQINLLLSSVFWLFYHPFTLHLQKLRTNQFVRFLVSSIYELNN